MTEELFEIDPAPSPMIEWKERRGIKTVEKYSEWIAHSGTFRARGETEEQALLSLAELLKIENWIEEEYANRNCKRKG